jgi:UDP-glucose 4-epimerase
MKQKTILITGGAGFIGSHLCERLIANSNSVISLDNYFTGKKENHIPGVLYIEGSTVDIEKHMKDHKIEILYHLGEYSRVEQSYDDIEIVLDLNIRGTYSVCEYVRKNPCKLIYAGSSTKFAGKEHHSPYSWVKATNTELVKKYHDWYDIDYAITYFYNVYGPRELKEGKYATLIAKYIEQMRIGEKLTVVDPGIQKRNFTYIDDIIDALILIGAFGSGDEYGIGNDKAYSILDVAKLFGGEIEFLPSRRGNRLSAPVISEKTKDLGWSAKTDLETYILKLKENGWKHG